MKKPVPKTKLDELGELINSFKPNIVLSEFNYARCLKLLDSSKAISPKDKWHVMKGMVELGANRISSANEAAYYVLENSTNFSNLRNAMYILNHTFDLNGVCKTVDKIVGLIELLKIDPKGILPRDLGLAFLLNGELWLESSSFYSDAVSVNSHKYNYIFKDINEDLGVTEFEFKNILKIIKDRVFAHNLRILFFDYSYLDEEFLLLIYINRTIDEVIEINEEIVGECYKEGLLSAYNKISYTFVPYDEAVNG
ncbi:hypothetical protein [Acinetobacter proteolyticus]|uniref:hypothetical protein n=1 Tax=Acinetobacter proteolyticus TaxID=1776741 RepID=UPI003D97BE20